MTISNHRCQAVVALALALALATACTEKPATQPPPIATPSSTATGVPEAGQVGVVPAGPGKDTAATTSPIRSDMSKAEQSNAMPMPGQVNDHSTLALHPTSKVASAPR